MGFYASRALYFFSSQIDVLNIAMIVNCSVLIDNVVDEKQVIRNRLSINCT